MNLTNQWVEVFRAGDYGAKGLYTAADLDAMIANYDPQKHEAPIVLGHPENDAPAYGWVEGLKRDGETLLAKFAQVSPKLEEMVQSGAFKKRSISFYRGPQNVGDRPNIQLRHVGFLGAMPPEVKGLADVKFREGKFETVEFNQTTEEGPAMDLAEIKKQFSEMQQSLLDGLKNLLKGNESARNFTEADLHKALESSPVMVQLKGFETKFTEFEKTQSEATKIAASAATVQLGENAVRELKDKRKWIPAFDKMGVAAIFGELAKSQATIEFGEGDKKVKKTHLQLFADFLAALPEIVPTKEIAGAAASAKRAGSTKFNETANVTVDPSSVAFDEAVKARMKEKKIGYGAAMSELNAEGFVPAAAGAV